MTFHAQNWRVASYIQKWNRIITRKVRLAIWENHLAIVLPCWLTLLSPPQNAVAVVPIAPPTAKSSCSEFNSIFAERFWSHLLLVSVRRAECPPNHIFFFVFWSKIKIKIVGEIVVVGRPNQVDCAHEKKRYFCFLATDLISQAHPQRYHALIWERASKIHVYHFFSLSSSVSRFRTYSRCFTDYFVLVFRDYTARKGQNTLSAFGASLLLLGISQKVIQKFLAKFGIEIENENDENETGKNIVRPPLGNTLFRLISFSHRAKKSEGCIKCNNTQT